MDTASGGAVPCWMRSTKRYPREVFNANAGDPSANVLMDVPENFPGYTHIALRVVSKTILV
jgi:hypothetical protein